MEAQAQRMQMLKYLERYAPDCTLRDARKDDVPEIGK